MVIEGLSVVGVNDGVGFADDYLSNGEGVLGLAVGKGFSTVMRWVLGHR